MKNIDDYINKLSKERQDKINERTQKLIESESVIPYHVFVLDELEARGWSRELFAEKLEVSVKFANQICYGKAPMTDEVALALARAFGTSRELWINLGK